MHEVPPQLRSLADGEGEGIVGVWNAVVKDAPPMCHWTVEEFMARVNRIEGIDLSWRNYSRK